MTSFIGEQKLSKAVFYIFQKSLSSPLSVWKKTHAKMWNCAITESYTYFDPVLICKIRVELSKVAKRHSYPLMDCADEKVMLCFANLFWNFKEHCLVFRE